MTRASRKSLHLIGLYAISALSTVAANPGFHYRANCNCIITGGSVYRMLDQSDNGQTINLHDVRAGTTEVLAKADQSFQNVQLAPSCERFAYEQFDRTAGGMAVHVTRVSGENEYILAGAYVYTWAGSAAESDWIGFVAGEPSDGFPGFKSQGTWIMNATTGEKRQIHPEGYDLAWSEFDRSFYIWNVRDTVEVGAKVQRFDLDTMTLNNTSYHGIDISPKGTYYHTRVYDGEDFKVYTRTTNEDITPRYATQMKQVFHGDPSYWINDSKILLGSYRPMNITPKIVDFAKVETWEIEEEVVGFAGNEEKELLLLVDGKVVTRKFEDVAELIYPLPEDSKEGESNSKE